MMRTILIVLFSMFLFPFSAAANQPELDVRTASTTCRTGEELTVDVYASDMAPVYGAEMEVAFDPTLLEVVDMDPEAEGVQIEPGNFFDLTENHFSLQNHVDNENGVIKYAMSLLNPAPSSQGEGAIARVAFRAKKPGKAALHIIKGKFGDRDGKVLVPSLESVHYITVKPDGFAFTSKPLGVATITLTLLTLALLTAVRLKRKSERIPN